MKTLPLSCEYKRLSPLSELDKPLFYKLLRGGEFDSQKRLADNLRIMPVALGSELTCCGFEIEHHQLFLSELDGKFYLVFYPVEYWKNPLTTKVRYSYYILGKAHHQDNYYCLMRHNVYDTYQLGDGCALIRHT